MFSKASFFPLVIVSLSCFGQVTVISGTATTVGPSAAIAPLVSTPDIALPGSGSAVGAPLASAAANDSRFSRGPSVYNPNGAEYVLPATSGSGVGAGPGAEPKNAAAEQFEFGIQHFESGFTDAVAPPISLGQIARNYRSQPLHAIRSYTNDNIAQMNAAVETVADLGIRGAVLASTAVAENRAPALPQSDREVTTNTESLTLPTPAEGPPHQTADQLAPAPASVSTVSRAATTARSASSEPSKLSQIGSFLVVLSLIGGAAVVGGALFRLLG